jgi:hypothetical protein
MKSGAPSGHSSWNIGLPGRGGRTFRHRHRASAFGPTYAPIQWQRPTPIREVIRVPPESVSVRGERSRASGPHLGSIFTAGEWYSPKHGTRAHVTSVRRDCRSVPQGPPWQQRRACRMSPDACDPSRRERAFEDTPEWCVTGDSPMWSRRGQPIRLRSAPLPGPALVVTRGQRPPRVPDRRRRCRWTADLIGLRPIDAAAGSAPGWPLQHRVRRTAGAGK